MRHSIFISLIILVLCHQSTAQKVITATVKDAATTLPLAGVIVQCGDKGTVTNEQGEFTLSTDKSCVVQISYLGYGIKSYDTNSDIPLEILLEEESQILDATTVTATKFAQRLSESTVSIDVIKPNLLKSTNTIKADGILNKLPGVQVVGGQANIRGGSGYSYGAGSRVMLLLDDLPALQVDAGYANWGDLPTENVGQIEVVKGASSSLYGSSALNGIIHFRRQTPSITPTTNVFTSFQTYFDPADPKYKWWGSDYLPYSFAIGGSHLRKINRLDLTLHGMYLKSESVAKETFENRKRVGVSLKYKLTEKLYIGANTLLNSLYNSDFFIWRNALRGIYEPFEGTVSSGDRTRFNLDPYVHYYASNNVIHKLNTRYFYTNNKNNNNQQNASSTYYTEYQFNKHWPEANGHLTIGAVTGITSSKAELFGDTSYLYTNAALYTQLDKKFNKLTTSAGLRYEYNKQNSPEEIGGFTIPGGKVTDGQVITRLGLNYSFTSYNSVRLSWGQGYRYPTVTERFINTSFGGFNVFPNPILKPEYGWSAEAAYKRSINIGDFHAFADVATFISEYEDMIEFTFLENPYGFKPINVGNTQIAGFELGFNGGAKYKNGALNIITGYTYIDPKYKNLSTSKELQDNLSTSQNVLKYRSKHSAKIDIEGFYKKIGLGWATQYYSHMINIDKRFEYPLTGLDLFSIKAFRDQNNAGYLVSSMRASMQFTKKYKLSLLMGNIFNKAYTERPGALESPRSASMRIDASF
jgi:outer membrane receptor protein involved in Fe transport